MKKIICLVDYSNESDNAVQYATRLALDTSSKLLLVASLHLKQASGIVSGGRSSDTSRAYRLAGMCDQVRGTWRVPCDYKEFSNEIQREQILIDNDVWLIISGIRVSSEVNSNQLLSLVNFSAGKTSKPILLIPHNFQYKRPSRILYAYDYMHEQTPPVLQLQNLTEQLNSDLRFLTILRKKYSPDLEEKMEAKGAELKRNWRGHRSLTVDYIFYTDVAKCIDHYVDQWRSDDIVVFSVEKPSLFRRIFHKSVIREMTHCSDYPLMIIRK